MHGTRNEPAGLKHGTSVSAMRANVEVVEAATVKEHGVRLWLLDSQNELRGRRLAVSPCVDNCDFLSGGNREIQRFQSRKVRKNVDTSLDITIRTTP